MTLTIIDTPHNNDLPCAECQYAECCILFTIMLSVIFINVVKLWVIMMRVGAPLIMPLKSIYYKDCCFYEQKCILMTPEMLKQLHIKTLKSFFKHYSQYLCIAAPYLNRCLIFYQRKMCCSFENTAHVSSCLLIFSIFTVAFWRSLN